MKIKSMTGNEALAEGAMRAAERSGVKLGYSGYPITPQSPIGEKLAEELDKRGGKFRSAASEIQVINIAYGTAAAGGLAMTSTSSPGRSLMLEGESYIAGANLPVLSVNIQRGGPALGGIQPSQQDYFQSVKGGGHGGYKAIVLAPASVYEMYIFPEMGFFLAEKYRIPVTILGDGAIGNMAEPIDLDILDLKVKTKIPVKPWALTGTQGKRPPNRVVAFSLDPYKLEKLNVELFKKYQEIEEEEQRWELINLENPDKADIICVAYGMTARKIIRVIKTAKQRGINVGLIRPITLWPFPKKAFEEIIEKSGKDFLVVEMSFGQMVEDVERVVKGRRRIHFCGRAGGVIPTGEEILEFIEEILTENKKSETLNDLRPGLKRIGPASKETAASKIESPAVKTETAVPVPGGNWKKVYSKPKSLTDKPFTYCPGCGHGIAHRLVAEVIDELDIQGKTIVVWPVGCAVMGYEFLNLDFAVAPHGRAPAAAIGIKDQHPEAIVFTYQGDGDLAAIGLLETLYAAIWGENITVIFINNTFYGMTGGQDAPTTLPGQKTTTTPEGKKGMPIQVAELLSVLKTPAYIARVMVTSPKEIKKAKEAIKKAFLCQLEGRGYSLVEILSPCPTNWRLSPKEAMKWIETEMIPYFPLGTFRDKFAKEEKDA